MYTIRHSVAEIKLHNCASLLDLKTSLLSLLIQVVHQHQQLAFCCLPLVLHQPRLTCVVWTVRLMATSALAHPQGLVTAYVAP